MHIGEAQQSWVLGTERQSPAKEKKKNSWAPSVAFKRKINLRACSIPSVENKSHCETPVTVLLELVSCLKCSAMCSWICCRLGCVSCFL